MKISSKNVKENLIFSRQKSSGEEEKKNRKLILLDYTEQEKLAGSSDYGKEVEKEVEPGKKKYLFLRC